MVWLVVSTPLKNMKVSWEPDKTSWNHQPASYFCLKIEYLIPNQPDFFHPLKNMKVSWDHYLGKKKCSKPPEMEHVHSYPIHPATQRQWRTAWRLLVLCTSRLEMGAGGWLKAHSAASSMTSWGVSHGKRWEKVGKVLESPGKSLESHGKT